MQEESNWHAQRCLFSAHYFSADFEQVNSGLFMPSVLKPIENMRSYAVTFTFLAVKSAAVTAFTPSIRLTTTITAIARRYATQMATVTFGGSIHTSSVSQDISFVDPSLHLSLKQEISI